MMKTNTYDKKPRRFVPAGRTVSRLAGPAGAYTKDLAKTDHGFGAKGGFSVNT